MNTPDAMGGALSNGAALWRRTYQDTPCGGFRSAVNGRGFRYGAALVEKTAQSRFPDVSQPSPTLSAGISGSRAGLQQQIDAGARLLEGCEHIAVEHPSGAQMGLQRIGVTAVDPQFVIEMWPGR
jgi:hypothetical protein